MKYISLLGIFVLVFFTWWFSQKDNALTLSQQTRLLNVIKEYMTQAVKAKEPDAAQIEFSNLYTETVEPGRVIKAHFKFSYLQNIAEGAPNKVYRKGHFLVTSNDGRQWKAQIDQINDVQVEFIDPLNIEGQVGALPEEPPGESAEEVPAIEPQEAHEH